MIHLVSHVFFLLSPDTTNTTHFTHSSTRNDAVVPVADSYAGCEANEHGLCAFDTVVSVLQDRIAEIDFDWDCFGNYTAEAGVDYNGRAPPKGTGGTSSSS